MPVLGRVLLINILQQLMHRHVGHPALLESEITPLATLGEGHRSTQPPPQHLTGNLVNGTYIRCQLQSTLGTEKLTVGGLYFKFSKDYCIFNFRSSMDHPTRF